LIGVVIPIAAHRKNVLSLIVAHTLAILSDSSAAQLPNATTPIDTENAEIVTDPSESQPTNAESSIDRVSPSTARVPSERPVAENRAPTRGVQGPQ
jgi:hypothetical protein